MYDLKVVGKLDTCDGKFEICILAKHHKRSYNSNVDYRSREPLELVHSDICKPIDPISRDGFRYVVSFLDDFTGFKAVYLLNQKSEMLEKFKKYETWICTWMGKKILRIRCDQDGEYRNREF